MIIQDLVIMVGSIGFSIALLPSVLSKSKPSWWTSLMTGTILASYVWAFATLGLTYSAITTSMTSIIWFILLYQKAKGGRTKWLKKQERGQ